MKPNDSTCPFQYDSHMLSLSSAHDVLPNYAADDRSEEHCCGGNVPRRLRRPKKAFSAINGAVCLCVLTALTDNEGICCLSDENRDCVQQRAAPKSAVTECKQ